MQTNLVLHTLKDAHNYKDRELIRKTNLQKEYPESGNQLSASSLELIGTLNLALIWNENMHSLEQKNN